MSNYTASKADVGDDELAVALCKEYSELFFEARVHSKVNYVSIFVNDASKRVTRLRNRPPFVENDSKSKAFFLILEGLNFILGISHVST